MNSKSEIPGPDRRADRTRAGRNPWPRPQGGSHQGRPKSKIINPTLSLCMIVKDEEKFLPGCLESVKDYVNEIIIVDTGSTDSTIEIAKRYGAKVYVHEWENSFSKARNYSLKYATCDWIMWLDADEEVDKEDAHNLKEVIKDPVGCETTHRVDVIYLPLFSKFDGGKRLAVANTPKIFRNHLGFHFEGIVHNALKFSGHIKKVNIKAYHHGYNQDEEQLEKKFLRTSSLLKKQIKHNPEDPNPHQYLATAYSERKNYDECIQAALKAIELYERHDKSSRLLLLTYYTISVAYRYKGELKNAEKYSLKAIKLYPQYVDHYDMLSIIYFLQKDYDKFFHYTERYFEILRAIKTNPSMVLEVPYNTLKNDWVAYSRMSIVYYELGNDDEGERSLKNAIKSADNAWEPHLSIGKYFLKNENFKLAERFLKDGLRSDSGNKSILYYLAETYEKSESPDKAFVQFRKITELYPDEMLAQYSLGLLSLKADKLDEAIDLFKKVINKDIEHLGALFNMAVAYEIRGDNVQAKNIYNDILTKKPEYTEVLIRLGSLYLNESNYDRAKECFLNTLSLKKYLLETHLALSRIYIFLNDMEACVASCDELLKCLGLPRNLIINNISDLSNIYIKIGTALLEQQNELLANCSFGIAALLGNNSPNLSKVVTESKGS